MNVPRVQRRWRKARCTTNLQIGGQHLERADERALALQWDLTLETQAGGPAPIQPHVREHLLHLAFNAVQVHLQEASQRSLTGGEMGRADLRHDGSVESTSHAALSKALP
jgi:hypothetical protein